MSEIYISVCCFYCKFSCLGFLNLSAIPNLHSTKMNRTKPLPERVGSRRRRQQHWRLQEGAKNWSVPSSAVVTMVSFGGWQEGVHQVEVIFVVNMIGICK